MTFYERFLKICEEKGYSRAYVSHVLGISLQTIDSWRVRGFPQAGDTLLSISRLLNVSPYYLIYEEKTETEFDTSNFSKLTPEQKTIINDLILVMVNRNKDKKSKK